MEPLKSFQGFYDIPVEDLKRYRHLTAEEIFQWLGGILNLTAHVSAKNPTKSRTAPKKKAKRR